MHRFHPKKYTGNCPTLKFWERVVSANWPLLSSKEIFPAKDYTYFSFTTGHYLPFPIKSIKSTCTYFVQRGYSTKNDGGFQTCDLWSAPSEIVQYIHYYIQTSVFGAIKRWFWSTIVPIIPKTPVWYILFLKTSEHDVIFVSRST